MLDRLCRTGELNRRLLTEDSDDSEDEAVTEEDLKTLLKIHKRRRNYQKLYHSDILNSQYTYYSAGLLTEDDRFPAHQQAVLEQYEGVFDLDITQLEKNLNIPPHMPDSTSLPSTSEATSLLAPQQQQLPSNLSLFSPKADKTTNHALSFHPGSVNQQQKTGSCRQRLPSGPKLVQTTTVHIADKTFTPVHQSQPQFEMISPVAVSQPPVSGFGFHAEAPAMTTAKSSKGQMVSVPADSMASQEQRMAAALTRSIPLPLQRQSRGQAQTFLNQDGSSVYSQPPVSFGSFAMQQPSTSRVSGSQPSTNRISGCQPVSVSASGLLSPAIVQLGTAGSSLEMMQTTITRLSTQPLNPPPRPHVSHQISKPFSPTDKGAPRFAASGMPRQSVPTSSTYKPAVLTTPVTESQAGNRNSSKGAAAKSIALNRSPTAPSSSCSTPSSKKHRDNSTNISIASASAAAVTPSPTPHPCTRPYTADLSWNDNKLQAWKRICDEEVVKVCTEWYIFQKYRSIVLKNLAMTCCDKLAEKEGRIISSEHQKRLQKLKRERNEAARLKACESREVSEIFSRLASLGDRFSSHTVNGSDHLLVSGFKIYKLIFKFESYISSSMILAEVSGIPPWYTVGDVRWYFAEAVNAGLFVTFHYNYRSECLSDDTDISQKNASSADGPIAEPQQTDDVVTDCPPSTSTAFIANVEVKPGNHAEDADTDQDNQPCCCIVELVSEEARHQFINDFSGQHWLDNEENPVDDWVCIIKKISIKPNTDPDSLSAIEGTETELQMSEAELSRHPYSEELVRTNPYPQGNVATPKNILKDFVLFGRIDHETAEDLGLLEIEQDAELAQMVSEIRGEVEYAVVEQIPHTFRSRDLRAYFQDFVDWGGFLLFHFNHRAMRPGDPLSPLACVIKLTRSNLQVLLEHYHDHHWVDAEGNQFAAKCMIRPPAEEELNSKKVMKELGSMLFPRGNVGTTHDLLMSFWYEGRISDAVAKRLGLDEGNDDIEEDIQYEILPDGSRRKVKRRRTAKKNTHRNSADSGLDTSQNAQQKSKFASFEAHTSGFGRKLMEKLGWKEGSGLGKDQAGLYEPVAVEMEKSKSKSRSGVGSGKNRKTTKSGAHLPMGIQMT